MTQDEALAPLRRGGLLAITAFLAGNAALIVPVGVLIRSRETGVALVLALLAVMLPVLHCYRREIDAQARFSCGLALALMPLIYIYLFRDHPWQMDLHMHVFVCFSMMALLLDARPILVGAGVTLVHHLLFYLLVPDLVFPGSGSLSRVLLHGFLVACIAVAVLTTTRLIARLTMADARARGEADEARVRAEQALLDADGARDRAETALAQSRAAEARAEREHRERLAAEAALGELSRARRTATADRIEAGIGALVEELQSVAGRIAEQAKDISSVSAALVEQAGGLGAASASAVQSIENVARNSDELTDAIRSVGNNAQEAQGVALATADSVATLAPGIDMLTREVDTARGILAMVSEIASQSNLLALNASIEAARSGEAGRGFAVVAGEMKQMAAATGRAAAEIAAKLGGIADATSAFRSLIVTSTAHADRIKTSSAAIFAAIEQQQVATYAIAEGAERVLARAVDTDSRSRTLTEVAAANNAIATDATVLAGQLGQRAEELRTRMAALLGNLRAA